MKVSNLRFVIIAPTAEVLKWQKMPKLTLSFKEERMTADQVNKTESATTTSSIDSPGKLLTEARIGKNLSIDDVAALMCVTTRLVKSIEKDDYPNQRVDIFMHSHIKRYCKIVQTDPNKIFAKLESLGFKSHNTSASITKASHKQVVALTQDKAKKYLICTVLFMLASLSVLVIGQHAKLGPQVKLLQKNTFANLPATVAKPIDESL